MALSSLFIWLHRLSPIAGHTAWAIVFALILITLYGHLIPSGLITERMPYAFSITTGVFWHSLVRKHNRTDEPERD